MKKILIPALVAGVLAASVLSAPLAEAEKDTKSTTPVVAAVSAEYSRQMAPERASRERVRAAVDKHKAQEAKIAKAKYLAKKKAIAKKRAALLAEQKRQARLAEQRAAIAAQKAAIQKQAERKKVLASKPPKVYSKPSNTVYSGGSARGYAQSVLSADQFGCLDSLFAKESGWNAHAMNPSSGAYGIPQALPGSKMASAGADWQTNPVTQVKWGLGYIASRYGTPCAAWGHSQSVGWY